MNRWTKRAVIAALLRARRYRLANAVASLVVAKMTVQEALNVLDLDPQQLGDPAVLKQIYRARSLEHHPDRGGSKEKMQQINEAYEVLRRAAPPGGGRYRQTPSERAEEELRQEEAFTIVEQGLRATFDEKRFTAHIEKHTGKKFNATSTIKRNVSRYGGGDIKLDAHWVSQDGLTTFEMDVWSDLRSFEWGPRKLGAGGQDYSFSVHTLTRIFHETRKVKFRQSDWNLSSDSRVVFDPEKLFPKKKISTMMSGKEKKRKFAKRDMLLGLEKLVGARVWYSGKDVLADVPFGKDDQYLFQMHRNTMLGQAAWSIHRVYRGKPGYKGTEKLMVRITTVPEAEPVLQALVDLKRQSKNVDDLKRLGSMVEQMGRTIGEAWQAGKLG